MAKPPPAPSPFAEPPKPRTCHLSMGAAFSARCIDDKCMAWREGDCIFIRAAAATIYAAKVKP